MKIKIPLTNTALAGNFGTDYAGWQDRMKQKPNFGEIKRLDDNKMVAVDTAGNTIETYVVDTDIKNPSADTLDAEQKGTPSDKTKNDTNVGENTLDKGA